MTSENESFLVANGTPEDWARQLTEASDAERAAWLVDLEQLADERVARIEEVLKITARQIVVQPVDDTISLADWASAVAAGYRRFPADSACRYWLLMWLNRSDSPETLNVLAELLATDPPAAADATAAIVSRLLQRPPQHPESLYPRLLDGIAHRESAAPILDLTNYYYRSGLLPTHPAESRRDQLSQLLAALVGEMKSLETGSGEETQSEIVARIADTVALTIALCEALAQVGGPSHLDPLRAAMELTHRRIRVVAAAALARLGDEDGKAMLLSLAAEPVARRHAIEFADELQLGDEIDAQFRAPAAIAESKLAFWLSQPSQFGIPPTRLEAVAERQCYWPGFDEPEELFLFRFEYQVGEASFANIALSGAQVQATGADLTDLPHDDVFSLFAGLGIDHEDVYEIRPSDWSDGHQQEADRLLVKLRAAGFRDFQPQLLCFFFDEISLAGTATKDGTECVVVAGPQEELARPLGNPQRPLTVVEIVAMHRGQAVLKTFNVDS